MHKRIVKRKSKKGNKVMYSLRFFLKIGKDTDKQPYKSANFLLKGKNDPLHKNHQHLTDLFDEIAPVRSQVWCGTFAAKHFSAKS